MPLICFDNPSPNGSTEWIQGNAIRFVFSLAGIVLTPFVTVLCVSVRLLKTALVEAPAVHGIARDR